MFSECERNELYEYADAYLRVNDHPLLLGLGHGHATECGLAELLQLLLLALRIVVRRADGGHRAGTLRRR